MVRVISTGWALAKEAPFRGFLLSFTQRKQKIEVADQYFVAWFNLAAFYINTGLLRR